MKTPSRYLVLLFAILIVLLPTKADARIGVGVASGKIEVEDKLKPGIIYTLPSISVLNTGDEASDYEVGITYHTNQPEHTPPEDWFTFSPKQFRLEPGGAQKVDVRLNVPIKVEPGKYFAYVEGRPLARVDSGKTSIGVAAATKLYFTVVPASFLAGVYYKAISLWKLYEPWSSRIALIAAVLFLLFFFKKFFNIDIKRKNTGQGQKVSGQQSQHE